MNIDQYNLDIPGWMSETDLEILKTLASYVPSQASILEIGCFVGRSTYALYSGKKPEVKLSVVDTFEVNETYKSSIDETMSGDPNLINNIVDIAKNENSWENAFRHCLPQHMLDQIEVNVSSSNDYTLPDNFNDEGHFNMVFIDANHSMDNVHHDIIKYAGRHTLLVGDDFSPKKLGVANAIALTREILPRKLIMPAGSKIWIMVPNGGYWHRLFKSSVIV
jgi:predicted O-methyltransferase YrrM